MDKFDLRLTGLHTGFEVVDRWNAGTAIHLFSHIRMTMHVEGLILMGSHESIAMGEGAKWVVEGEMQDVGLATMVRKAFNLIGDKKKRAADGNGSILQWFERGKRKA